MPARSQARNVYRLRVELRDSNPLIWRRFEVPGEITLPRLDRALQIVMGWENCHLHEFRIGGNAYAQPDPEDHHFGRTVLDERRVRLQKVISNPGSSFEYIYDFGDNWRHDITLESVLPAIPRKLYPVSTAGEWSAPPEDVGGIPGYAHYLEALRDIRHPDHRTLLAWRGRFNPANFSINRVNRALREEFHGRARQAARTAVQLPESTAPTGAAEELDLILRSLVKYKRLPRLPHHN